MVKNHSRDYQALALVGLLAASAVVFNGKSYAAGMKLGGVNSINARQETGQPESGLKYMLLSSLISGAAAFVGGAAREGERNAEGRYSGGVL